MAGTTDKLPKIFDQLGITKTLQKIRFGGVVGKQTILGVTAVLVLASIAFRANADDLVLLAAMSVFVVLVIVGLNFIYAHLHPMEATLEGSEIIALQHQTLAAKTLIPPAETVALPKPGGGPPELKPSSEPDQP